LGGRGCEVRGVKDGRGWAMPKGVGYIYSITSTSSILVHEIPGNSRELDDQTTFSNENYHISL